MKQIKLFVIGITVTTLLLPMIDNVQARGGRRSGGGWSSGRGGEYHGGEGERGGGRGDWGNRGDHNRDDNRGKHDNGNNNNNTTYNVNGYGYGGGWGWGWGAADAAIAGVAVADAVQPTTVVVEQPVVADTPQTAPNQPPLGAQVTVLPPGSVSQNVNGAVAYQCGNVWYKPFFGSSGVYYEVVPPPGQ